MPGAEESQQGAWALRFVCASTTLAQMDAGPSAGRYRLRTMLRGVLPYFLSDRIPKGSRDCGNHEWYRQDDNTDACYHCEVGRRSRAPEPEPQRQSTALAL